MKRTVIAVAIALLAYAQLPAQQLELEKTYKISRASKRGELSGLDYDRDAKTYTLTYLTDMKKKSDKYVFKYEQYVFDNDFNFVKDGEMEEEADVMKKKFKWFKFKGEDYVTYGNTVNQQIMGGMVLKRKKVTHTYRWLLGGYTKKTELLEKVKPRTEEGRSYTLVQYAEDDVTGDLYILATVNAKIGTRSNDEVGDLTLLKYNNELQLVCKLDFEFPYKQALAFMQVQGQPNPDDEEEIGISDFTFVFAPTDMYAKKVTDPDNNNYTYVHVDANCKITEKFNFRSPSSYWRIDQMITKETGEKFFYGPAQAGKDKYFNKAVAGSAVKMTGALGSLMSSSETKFKAVQLMKVVDGKMAFLTETTLDEFKAKQQFPPKQRKTPDYEGREFGVRSYNFASNGDLIILGQNYDRDKDGNIKKFEDILGFHFGPDGKLRAQYGVDTKEDGKIVTSTMDTHYGISTTTYIITTTTRNFACPQQLIEGSDGNMYWLLREIRDIREGKLLTYPRIGKINMKNSTLSDITTFGRGDGYYLNPTYPTLETDKGESIVFFGADKPGRELWFARVKLK
ncbi:MAG: hypothetical protein JSS79_06495 [Bacteroidetes bacterium]|nr:hypothetical protein [Bacteroidota bacterium]